jgi:hypothetical protein
MEWPRRLKYAPCAQAAQAEGVDTYNHYDVLSCACSRSSVKIGL